MNALAIKEKRIPQEPGVYLMKDEKGSIIYIGKAKNLHKRVLSYFTRHNPDAGWKTAKLVSKIKDLDFVVTDNEMEAFLLESNLIKRYRPVFNIELKDQQRYTYLKITDEPFPRLLVARRSRTGQFQGPKGRIYGPFVRGSSKYLTVGLLRKLFKIRVCNRLPKTPCLQYFIKNCDAPCIANVTESRYLEGVNMLAEILDGKSSIDRFTKTLEADMKRASDIGDYERAKDIRDTLYRLDNLRVRQKMESKSRHTNEEFVGILRDSRKGVAHVMSFRRTRGVISDRKKFEFELIGDNSLSSFLLQYCSSMPAIPSIIYTNEEPESRKILEQSLEKMAGYPVRIVDVSGQRHELMDLIMRNLSMYIERGYSPAVVDLKNALNLSMMPEIMDCFDVSNLGTDIAVGACCRFVNGKPDKAGYRMFKIKSVFGQNDFAMIGEIVTRRYRLEKDLPDLIVIDGGRAQLGSAYLSLSSLGLNIPCIGLAKENEEIHRIGSDPLLLSKSSAALHMLQHIRDEAHRFGLAYNRRLRKITRL
ncbi:MAG: excinuclease ABC subunit C [Nitrososphaera sp.]|nr:excinuclease ABC subunit C [Nitrososphaera sp.]